MESKLLLLFAATVLYSCTPPVLPKVQDRATFDLNCPVKQIQLTQIDPNTIGARGCGQQGTYLWNCGYLGPDGSSCRWILNGTLSKIPQ